MSPPPFPTKRMLGIDFFVGTAAEAIAHISKYDGRLVAPAAPSFIALQDDPDYRRAIADANLAIADSGWAILFWRLLRREKLTRISGLALFKALLETAEARTPGNLFFHFAERKGENQNTRVRPGIRVSHHSRRLLCRAEVSEVRGQRSEVRFCRAGIPACRTNRSRQAGALALHLFPLRRGGATSPRGRG